MSGEFHMRVAVWIPIKITHENHNGDLVIRAEARLHADSWKRPNYPSSQQIEDAMRSAFQSIDLAMWNTRRESAPEEPK